jgi:hypothetical protein
MQSEAFRLMLYQFRNGNALLAVRTFDIVDSTGFLLVIHLFKIYGLVVQRNICHNGGSNDFLCALYFQKQHLFFICFP